MGFTSGVRVIRDRGPRGRIPILDRVPTTAATGQGGGRVWALGALGSRGLIHHAYLAEVLAKAVVEDTLDHVDSECRLYARRTEE